MPPKTASPPPSTSKEVPKVAVEVTPEEPVIIDTSTSEVIDTSTSEVIDKPVVMEEIPSRASQRKRRKLKDNSNTSEDSSAKRKFVPV